LAGGFGGKIDEVPRRLIVGAAVGRCGIGLRLAVGPSFSSGPGALISKVRRSFKTNVVGLSQVREVTSERTSKSLSAAFGFDRFAALPA
jgi:hypothetical protein